MITLISKLDEKRFKTRFSTDTECLKFLAESKWARGFKCRKCGNANFCHGKTPFSRRCTRCKHEESASAHTMFHGCKIPLKTAFEIAYLVCKDPGISTYTLSNMLGKRQMTCWKFKKKILECIEQERTPSITSE
jgi:hypothetical protein